MLAQHLSHIDYLMATLDAQVEDHIRPFAAEVARWDTLPGINRCLAQILVAEVGADLRQFLDAAQLASWAGLCPGHHESAGKRRSGKTRKGNPALRSAMCEAAWAASHGKDTYLAAQFLRFKRRFGTKSETKAIFAVAHTMIVIVWLILAN